MFVVDNLLSSPIYPFPSASFLFKTCSLEQRHHRQKPPFVFYFCLFVMDMDRSPIELFADAQSINDRSFNLLIENEDSSKNRSVSDLLFFEGQNLRSMQHSSFI